MDHSDVDVCDLAKLDGGINSSNAGGSDLDNSAELACLESDQDEVQAQPDDGARPDDGAQPDDDLSGDADDDRAHKLRKQTAHPRRVRNHLRKCNRQTNAAEIREKQLK